MGKCFSCIRGEPDPPAEPDEPEPEPEPKEPLLPTDKLAKFLWYHGHIENDEATARLKEGANEIDGAYLVYVMINDPVQGPVHDDRYILLVYYKGRHYRWEILTTTDGKYVLGEARPETVRHDTVEELIEAHRGVTGKPIRLDENNVATLSKSYVSHTQEFDNELEHKHSTWRRKSLKFIVSKEWYHGNISDEEAHKRLKEGSDGKDGAYLVYDRELHTGTADNQFEYLLLVNHQESSLKWKILKVNTNKYVLGEDEQGQPSYSLVKELIKAHRGVTGTPLRVDQDHVVTLSKSYICRTYQS